VTLTGDVRLEEEEKKMMMMIIIIIMSKSITAVS
jgi:hypothetical protein